MIARIFEWNTPKALANFSPVVGAQRQPWEGIRSNHPTLKALGLCGLTLSGFTNSTPVLPRVVAALQRVG